MIFSHFSSSNVRIASCFQAAAIFAHAGSRVSTQTNKDRAALAARVLQGVCASFLLNETAARLGCCRYSKLSFAVIPFSLIAEKMLVSERQKDCLSKIESSASIVSSLALYRLGHPLKGALATLVAAPTLYLISNQICTRVNPRTSEATQPEKEDPENNLDSIKPSAPPLSADQEACLDENYSSAQSGSDAGENSDISDFGREADG